jgi:hypothetical protein
MALKWSKNRLLILKKTDHGVDRDFIVRNRFHYDSDQLNFLYQFHLHLDIPLGDVVNMRKSAQPNDEV